MIAITSKDSDLFESRMVVAYVDSVIRTSGRQRSIHAALNIGGKIKNFPDLTLIYYSLFPDHYFEVSSDTTTIIPTQDVCLVSCCSHPE